MPSLGRRFLSLTRKLSRSPLFTLVSVVTPDVVGLEVAVDDPLLMSRGERIRQGNSDVEKLPERRPVNGNAQRFPPDELHGDEADPVRLFHECTVTIFG